LILNHHQHHHRYHHHHEGQGDQKIRLGRMGYWKSVQSIGLARQCVSAYQMKQAPARSLPSQSLNKAGRVGEAKSGKQVLGRTRYYRLGFLASLWRYCRRIPIEANVGKQSQANSPLYKKRAGSNVATTLFRANRSPCPVAFPWRDPAPSLVQCPPSQSG